MQNITTQKPPVTNWVQKLPSCTAILNKDLELIDASMGWYSLLGLDRKDVLGKAIYSIFPHLEPHHADSFEYSIEGIEDITFTDKAFHKKNNHSSLVWQLKPWKDGYGNIIGVVINVAPDCQNTPKTVYSNESGSMLCDKNEEVGSWEYNFAQGKVFWSNTFRDILRLPLDYQTSFKKTLSFFETAEERKKLRNAVREAMTTGKPWDDDFKVKDYYGNSKLVNIVGRPKFKNGKCVRIIGVVQSPKAKNTAKLQHKVIKTDYLEHDDLFDKVPTGLAILDLNTEKILKINNHLSGILNKSERFFNKKSYKDFVQINTNTCAEIKEALGHRYSFKNVQLPLNHKSIGEYVLNVSGNIITNAEGKEVLLVSCEDFTQRVSLEHTFSESLNNAHQEIDKMVHFAHMVSHNLKAHTTNFDLLLNFLRNEKDENERNLLIQMLFESTDSLTTTIKSLRELVSIRHMVNEQKSRLNVNEYFYKVMQSNIGLIKKKNVKIHNEITEDFTVNAIPAYLESILANLLLNAIHFVNDNEKPLLILTGAHEDKYTLLTFEDNSMGINLEKEGDNVFALYKKLQNMGQNTSMGLYLTKYQIELMGGKITVESDVGKGNTFKIFFPT